MDPQDRGTRGQPLISMGRSPSPGGLFGFRGSRNPVQTAQVGPKRCLWSLLDMAGRSKRPPRRPKTPPRRPQDAHKTPREVSKK